MSAVKIIDKNSTHEVYYDNEIDAMECFLDKVKDIKNEGVTLYKAQNHDWMMDGEVYYAVRWTRVPLQA